MPISGLIRAAIKEFPLDADGAAFQGPRAVYPLFALARRIRRRRNPPVLAERLSRVRRDALEFLDTDAAPVQLLWHHWLLQLGEKYLHQPADPTLLARLWRQALRAQNSRGYLHPLGPETLLDGFVYDELCALHAAYNVAASARDPAMLDSTRRAVQWHVNNTQPDNTTHEPWALAAFAALDDTGTFAEQQLHDALTHRSAPPAPPAPSLITELLADALMTLDELSA